MIWKKTARHILVCTLYSDYPLASAAHAPKATSLKISTSRTLTAELNTDNYENDISSSNHTLFSSATQLRDCPLHDIYAALLNPSSRERLLNHSRSITHSNQEVNYFPINNQLIHDLQSIQLTTINQKTLRSASPASSVSQTTIQRRASTYALRSRSSSYRTVCQEAVKERVTRGKHKSRIDSETGRYVETGLGTSHRSSDDRLTKGRVGIWIKGGGELWQGGRIPHCLAPLKRKRKMSCSLAYLIHCSSD